MKKLILINAIVWASIILVGALLLKDHPNYQYFFGIIVFAAALMNGFLSNHSKKLQKANCTLN